jgi:predicted outer membrane protein
MKVRNYVLPALLAIAIGPALAIAQPGATQQQRIQQPGQTGQIGQQGAQQGAIARGGQQEQLVSILAGKLSLCNQVEIELAQIAVNQAERPEVKQYAQQVVQDHQQVGQQLEQIAPPTARLRTAQRPGAAGVGQASIQGQQAGEGVRPAQFTQRQSGSGGDQGLQDELLRISQRAAQNQLEMISESLRQFQGENFDKAFLTQQIAAHTMAIAELRALEGVGSQQFQQTVQRAQQVTQQHLETAKQLSQRFEQPGSGAAARQPQRDR